jgi:hypothetical protein
VCNFNAHWCSVAVSTDSEAWRWPYRAETYCVKWKWGKKRKENCFITDGLGIHRLFNMSCNRMLKYRIVRRMLRVSEMDAEKHFFNLILIEFIVKLVFFPLMLTHCFTFFSFLHQNLYILLTFFGYFSVVYKVGTCEIAFPFQMKLISRNFLQNVTSSVIYYY